MLRRRRRLGCARRAPAAPRAHCASPRLPRRSPNGSCSWGLAQQISPIRPIQLANGDPDDDTDFWLTIPGFGNSLIEAEADYATGRTSGEEEIRTRFRLASPRTQPSDGHVAAERETARSFTRSDRPETISDPWSVLGR